MTKADKDSAEGGDVSVRTDCDDYKLHVEYYGEKKQDCFEYDDDHEACHDAKDAFDDLDVECTDENPHGDSVKLEVHYNKDDKCFDKGECEGDEDMCDDAWDVLDEHACKKFTTKNFDDDEDSDDEDEDDSDDEDKDDREDSDDKD